MSTVREATYELLRRFGIGTIFGNPGSTELPFLKDFPDDFRYILGLQEATALGMAEGYARGTRNAAFVNLHTAPGLGNAMGALVTAYLDKTPLIVTAGQQDRRHVSLEPLLSGKLVELAKPYVKRSYEPTRAEDVPYEIQRAYHTAMQQPRGPVFLSIPMNDWDAEVDPLETHEVSYRIAPDPEKLEEAAAVLRGAESPAIVVGPGIAWSDGFEEVVALAEKMRAEVWQEGVSSLIGFPQSHPLFRGSLKLGQKLVHDQLSPYDAVLVLGAPVFTYYPYVPGPMVQEGTRVVQVTEDPEEAARAPVGTSVVGDSVLAARQLIELLPEASHAMPPAQEAPPVPEATYPMSVDYVMHTLSEVFPEDVVIADESTSSKAKLYKHVKVDHALGHHTSAAGGLGFCMPGSVGLKLALTERPVVCVIGDGSSMYSIQALWSAARYGLAVAFIVVNNGGYSILKAFRDSVGIADTVPGLDLPGLDLTLVARGLGCEGETVEKPEDLHAAVERALDSGSPYLLDVIVDPAVPKLLG